jgi:hypothetical protein
MGTPSRVELKWQDGIAAHQAESIDPDVWEAHREVISTKYHELTLTSLMNYMKEEHNFIAR